MKNKFVKRVILGTLLAAAPMGALFGKAGLAIFAGALWGSANLFLLKLLVQKMVLPGKKDLLRIALLALLKCPLLYGAGYFLLKIPQFPPVYLFLGFSLLFVMMGLMSFKVTLLKRVP